MYWHPVGFAFLKTVVTVSAVCCELLLLWWWVWQYVPPNTCSSLLSHLPWAAEVPVALPCLTFCFKNFGEFLNLWVTSSNDLSFVSHCLELFAGSPWFLSSTHRPLLLCFSSFIWAAQQLALPAQRYLLPIFQLHPTLLQGSSLLKIVPLWD